MRKILDEFKRCFLVPRRQRGLRETAVVLAILVPLYACIVAVILLGRHLVLKITFQLTFKDAMNELSSDVPEIMSTESQSLIGKPPPTNLKYALLLGLPEKWNPQAATVNGIPAKFTVWTYLPAYLAKPWDCFAVGVYSKLAVPGAIVMVDGMKFKLKAFGRTTYALGPATKRYSGPDLTHEQTIKSRKPLPGDGQFTGAVFEQGKAPGYAYFG